MNNTPLPGCPKILKWIFVFFNLLFAILGILLIALGSWLVVRANEFLQASGGIDQSTVVTATALGGSGLIIFCGLITFVLATIGVLGGICQARPLLVVFAVGLIIIVVIEFIGAVVVFVAFNQYRAFVDQVSSGMSDSLTLYREPDDPSFDQAANTFVDTVQRTFDCCGINAPSNWENTTFFTESNGFFPPTCCTGGITNCTMDSTAFHRTGCIPAIEGLLTTNRTAAVVAGVIALIILLVEVSGIVIAFGLCCCIRNAKLTLV